MELFNKDKSFQSLAWVDACSGEPLPDESIIIGHENNFEPVYAARANLDGNLISGKLSSGKCLIGNLGLAFKVLKYQVLTNPNQVKLLWIPSNDYRAWFGVRAGREVDGTELLLGRTIHTDGSIVPGKVYWKDRLMFYPVGFKELKTKKFEVLVCDFDS